MADLLIIGGGVAGLTAALYALRAGKSALILEGEAVGGQIASSPRVDNYPGLPAVSGLQLTDALLEQVLSLGAELELERVEALTRTPEGAYCARCAGGRAFSARAAIIASGARCRALGLAREAELTGHGVSYCALCDGAFYRGQDVAVVGGGNSAAQAAVFLADLCRSVTVLQQLPHFTCERRELDAMRARANITLRAQVEVCGLLGDAQLSGVSLRLANGQVETLPLQGLFINIGRIADNAPFAPLLTLDADGFIRTGEDLNAFQPGLFAAGDCRAKRVRQLTTATGDGAIAAVNACAYLDTL